MTASAFASSPMLHNDPVLAGYLEDAIGDAGPVGAGLKLTTLLGHVPGRRAALLGQQNRTQVVVKVFASPRAYGNHRRMLALDQAGLGTIAPQPFGVAADGHVGVLSYHPGEVLDSAPDDQFLIGAICAGAALARLHQSSARLDRAWTWRDEVERLARRAPSSLLPVAWGAERRPTRDSRLVPSHRDFNPRQVILTPAGTVRLIDFDDAAMAPTGLDVGNMVAHLRREVVVHGRARIVAEAAVRAFLAAYGATPPDLAQWVQVALIRLAGVAETRHHDPTQRDALLTLAGPALTAAAPQATVGDRSPDRAVRVEERTGAEPMVIKDHGLDEGAAVQAPTGGSRQGQ